MNGAMFSIDQNCHSLWDVPPKLQALAASGINVRHFVEDVDMAFTALGSKVDQPDLALARERYHRSGGADWGAAVFYSEFLGRQAVEIRQWEVLTGLKTNVLARQIGKTVDELYDEFSPGDNWQLIGSSYVGDKEHHRMIADLSVSETADFLRQIMDKARTDTLRAFPEKACQSRARDWFDAERRRLEDLLARHAGGKLVALYADWLRQYVGQSAELDVVSSLMKATEGSASASLLEMWCRHYDRAAELYNQSLDATCSQLHHLKVEQGSLPFFVTMRRNDHLVRTDLRLHDGAIHAAELSFPLDPDGAPPLAAMRQAGIIHLAGKAVMLAIQVRMGSSGGALALPYRGSVYMPAVQHFVRLLQDNNLLPAPLAPIIRVRLHLLDRMKEINTVIRLPDHLAGYFGASEIPAARLAHEYPALMQAAKKRLDSLRSDEGRRQWFKDGFPELLAGMERLDAQRRKLAEVNPKASEIRAMWKEVKAMQNSLLTHLLREIARDWQMREIDYWDSRGAILPWAIALGGREFYDSLITGAEIYRQDEADRHEP